MNKVEEELASFQSLWRGGFFKADPLDPMSSLYGIFGYVATSHVIYLSCIRQYVGPETVALEIGPGRGAWTRTLLRAKEIHVLDALSAEHNGFWECVGKQPYIHYHQVRDFSCAMLPADHFDYVFSYDALCHVSFSGIREYAENIYTKLRPGAHCFVMVADYRKCNAFAESAGQFSVANEFVPKQNGPLRAGAKWVVNSAVNPWFGRRIHRLSLEEDDIPRPGRWYHAGEDATCQMLENTGYRVLDPDIGADYRSPIIHFLKPGRTGM